MPNSRDSDSVRDLLHSTFPLPSEVDFVTRAEFTSMVKNVEDKIATSHELLQLQIKGSELSQRNWVLMGCLAMMVTGGGGFLTVVTKLDRLNEALPEIQQTLDSRKTWIVRQGRRDDEQDRSLESLDPKFQAMPFSEQPK